MKFKLTKAEYEALSPEMKLLYVADGDGYKLPLTDIDDPGELRRARDREKEAARVAKEQLATVQAELDKIKEEPARKNGDIATLEKAWEKKRNDDVAAVQARLDAANKRFETALIEEAANKLSSEIAAKPENIGLIKPHVMQRLEIVHDGDVPVVKIKDKTGRVSAMNFDELKRELVAEPMMGSVVVGSRASGAGGSGGATTGSGGGAGADKSKAFKDMTGPERTALYTSDPAEFKRLSEADKQEKEAKKFGGRFTRA